MRVRSIVAMVVPPTYTPVLESRSTESLIDTLLLGATA